MKVHSIDTGLFKLDGGAMFGVVPKILWQKLVVPDENNLCTWAMRCLLVEQGTQLILVDCGMGNKQDAKFFSHYQPHGEATLLGSLKKAGFEAADITDVLLTHLHFDHCGGAVTRTEGKLELTFPKARYWSNKAHWQWAVEPNAREKASFLKENILPIQASGHLHWIEDNLTPFENIEILQMDGHTEKMMLPLISYKNKKILYCADLIPSTAHIAIPYVMGYDMRPLITLAEKEQVLSQATNEDWLLALEHDASIELCSLWHTEKGIRMKENITWNDL